MWWKSAVNFSFFLSFATFRMRSSACDTLTRHCVRRVLCWRAFPLVPALRSTGSAALGSATDRSATESSALFAGFVATMAGSDFSCPYIIGYGSSPPRCGPSYSAPATRLRRPDTRPPSFRRDPFARERVDLNEINGLRLQKYANAAIDTQSEFPPVPKNSVRISAGLVPCADDRSAAFRT